MTITVYHNQKFMEYQIKSMTGKALVLEGAVIEAVADVSTDSLEKAFELTNHIDTDWTANSGVTSYGQKHRSSSVGDVFKKDSDYYVVESMGFRQLTPNEVYHLTFFSKEKDNGIHN